MRAWLRGRTMRGCATGGKRNEKGAAMKLVGIFALGAGGLLVAAVAANAQPLTPTPVDSNITVSTYAQTHGVNLSNAPCPYQGGDGCGGCYPEGIPPTDPIAAALAQLTLVDPEWAPIGPMIPGMDPSQSPNAQPVLVTGTIGLSKSPGDDFPGSHLSADYNAEIIPDDNGQLASGNSNGRVEFEWEGDKFPLFAWAGEGDRVLALGRWIFDCGHPFPGPEGTCSNNSAACIVDADCGPTCNLATGHCSNSTASNILTCTSDADCGPTCVGANFGYSSEMHPPQAVVMLRNNKSLPASHKGRTAIPASQADVYISSDGGGAGDRCTVTHLASTLSVLLSKKCFLDHCSKTTTRSCLTDRDCAHGETCIRLDPAQRLANVNASDFAFDMPLPPPPPSPTPATLEIRTKSFKPRSARMPHPIFEFTPGPTPNLHVVIPMTEPIRGGQLPNIFAERIRAGWKEDTTPLTHVRVQFTNLTINNPLKDSAPPVPRVCTNPTGGLTTTACATDADCTPGTCSGSGIGRHCHRNTNCGHTGVCNGASICVGGVTPGWRLWAEVNGDWIEFKKLQKLGSKKPFAEPPYEVPSPTPLTIPEHYTFDEYVPPAASIHLKVSGHSLNCLNMLFGHNLIDGLNEFGLTAGANCLQSSSHDVGKIDVTYNGPDFGTTAPGVPASYNVTSTGGDGGTCSVTTDQLCISDADCPAGACSTTAGACRTSADCLHCSNDPTKFCTIATQSTDCGSGNTCVTGSETCNNAETCNGACSNNPSVSCRADADCGAGNTCDYGGAFTLQYTVTVIP
jgi:hypothetical protein